MEGQGPLESCLRCEGKGKLGSSDLAPACPSCEALGCIARSGTLRIVPLYEMCDVAKRPAAIETERLLLDLPSSVPDVAEREYLDEALKCYKAGALRAAIVMCWNLAYDHLLTYVLERRLTDFNRQWPISYQKRNSQARVGTISVRDEMIVG